MKLHKGAKLSTQGRLEGAAPVGVLDIGSNSVRLVIYERHARALTPLYNEKSSCTLGRGVAADGKLAEAAVARALRAIRRFSLVVRLMRVEKIYILATSAVREASNGPDFAREVENIMGEKVQVLSGVQEAHFAALGVVAGMAAYSGVVGDLGGGSLELSVVENGKDIVGETFALGVIRTQDDADGSPAKAGDIAAERLNQSKIISANSGRTFCAIGGTWRALAKLHQREKDYPLRMIQHYRVAAGDMLVLCDNVARAYTETGTYAGADTISSTRRHLLPFGAAILAALLRAGQFDQVVFSALGVREGYLFGELDAAERRIDPLIQVCQEMAILRARDPDHAKELVYFTTQFMQSAGIEETREARRLRQAACWLSDIGWRGHPDYRGEQSVDLVAYGALIGIDHPARAFLSEVLAVRYTGLKHDSISQALLDLAGAEANRRARVLGALFRVAYPMSAGMPGVLPHVDFTREDDKLVLRLSNEFAFLDSERLRNRVDQLAEVAGFANATIRLA